LQRAGDCQGVGVRAGILLGPGADVAEFDPERAVHRNAKAEPPAEVELAVIGRDAIDGRLAAVTEARAGTQPQARAEAVNKVALADKVSVLGEFSAAEKLVVLGVKVGRCG
jgi:hypothetical protein